MRTPYASAGQVLAYIPWATFGTAQKPNASQVYELLIDAANDLDAALEKTDYSTPIPTGATESIDLLSSWNALGGAVYAVLAMPQGNRSPHYEPLESRWQAILKGIEEGERPLPDAGADSARANPRFGGEASPRFGRDGPAGIGTHRR